MIPPKFHGLKTRGLDSTPRSESFEGRFGRMFRSLSPATFGDNDLDNQALLELLAKHMVAQPEDTPTPETDVDDEENQGIDAGYTYLGQFIDHDLTFDPTSSLAKDNDPNGLIDFRSPRFDLDNIYGRGPDDQPYLYQADGLKMLLGRPLTGNVHDQHSRDLPRNTPDPLHHNQSATARALIGDPRNDENLIVSQLQSAMLRFHNRMVELMQADATQKGSIAPSFEQVQQQVRWHYQWIILHDFLPTIVRPEVMKEVLPDPADFPAPGKRPNVHDFKAKLKFFQWRNEPFIPVEFAVAAYRFGHSMIRPIYRLNTGMTHGEFGGRLMIFATKSGQASLRGFREFPHDHAVDWHLFFNADDPEQAVQGPGRVQKSYKIDTSLVNPLGKLPSQVVSKIPSLAARNLIRGWRMGLPSGQDVARHMGLIPLTDEELVVGKGTKGFNDNTITFHNNPDTTDPEVLANRNVTLTSLSSQFEDNAPLWFYILAEARNASFTGDDNATFQLGEVGGRIVAEVFIGLLLGDVHSFLYQNPNWTPRADFMRNGTFKMIDLLDQALKAQP